MQKNWLALFLFSVLVVLVGSAFVQVAQVIAPEPITPDPVEFGLFLVTITEFVRRRAGAQGDKVIGLVLLIGAVLWFSYQFPQINPWIISLISYVKVALGAMGTIDLSKTLLEYNAKKGAEAAVKAGL